MAKGKKRIWVIDAGHGGKDVGCEGTKGKEKDINLAVAKRVAELVRANISGVQVVMTRDTDKFLTLDQRAQTANNLGAELFLSIHVNAAPEASQVAGTETYYGPLDATAVPVLEAARKRNIQKSELLAWEMQKQYGLVGRPISRGVKRQRYYVILYTKMPSVLTEIGFISNVGDQNYMLSKKGQEEIAQCIYKGLQEYKTTIDAGKEKTVLAEMRRTGGKAKGVDSKSVYMAENHTVKADPATADTAINNTANLEPELESDALCFYVQVLSSKNKIATNDKRLKGLTDVKIVEKEGTYKYMAGATSDFAVARKNQTQIRKLFPDAFVVAFLGQRQISTADAMEMVVKK